MSEKNLSTRREEYEEKGLKNILKGKKKKRRIHTLKPGRIMHYQIGPDTMSLLWISGMRTPAYNP